MAWITPTTTAAEMGLDASIYGQFAQPVRSVADYQNAFAQQDQNRLAAMLGQQKLQEGQMALDQNTAANNERNALRSFLQGKDLSDPNVRQGVLAVAPLTGGAVLKQWGEADKLAADTAGVKATTGKTTFETSVAKANKAISDITALDTPQQALESLNAHRAAGDIDQIKYNSVLATLKPAFDDPAKFGGWKRNMVLAIMDAKDRIAATAPKVTMANAGGSLVPVNENADAGPVGAVVGAAPIKVTATPGELLSNGVAVAGLNETKRHNQATESQAAQNKSQLTGDQSKALLFGSRMKQSDAILGRMADQGVDQPGVIKRTAESLPLIGDGMGVLTNFTQSDKQQQVEQAQRDFVNAVLRRESGAAISQSEYESARKQYFPQPGDSDAVKARKSANRQLAINGMLIEVPQGMRESLTSNAPAASGSQVYHFDAKGNLVK